MNFFTYGDTLEYDTLATDTVKAKRVTPGKGDLRKLKSGLCFETNTFTLFHCNIQGFTTHQVQILVHLKLLNFSTFVALNETFSQ